MIILSKIIYYIITFNTLFMIIIIFDIFSFAIIIMGMIWNADVSTYIIINITIKR